MEANFKKVELNSKRESQDEIVSDGVDEMEIILAETEKMKNRSGGTPLRDHNVQTQANITAVRTSVISFGMYSFSHSGHSS